MRYITQIAKSPNYRLAIFDLHANDELAIFKDADLAERYKDQLNEEHRAKTETNGRTSS